MADTSPVSGVTSPPASTNRHALYWFTAEIQQMMYGFGDCSRPLYESAILVEEIVRSQLACVLHQASESAVLRNGRFISLEDFLFLLRRDKMKLRRLVKFMEVKDMKALATKNIDEDVLDPSAANMSDVTTHRPAEGIPTLKKRSKVCRDFLATIDDTGELLASVADSTDDPIKLDRLVRADARSLWLDAQNYREFHEARLISLHPGNKKLKLARFRDWLMTSQLVLDLRPNALAMEVLGYLANEMVAQVVDLALIVKKDRARTINTPIHNVMPNVYVNPVTSPPQTALASIKREAPVTSPTILSPGSDVKSAPLLSSGSGLKKAKKRTKSGSGSELEQSMTAIQPGDIHEAMRRYSAYIGPFSSYDKPGHLAMKHCLLST